MKNVIIVGANGATGSQLMQRLIDDVGISHIYTVHYRPTQFKSQPKVTEIIMDLADFSTLNIAELLASRIENRIDNKVDNRIDCAYCCLGTTRKKAGSVAAFRRVDKDYIINFARWVAANDIPQLHVISAVGANPNSASSYLQTKGETEQALKQLNIPSLYLYQPTLLHGKRDEFRLMEALAYYPLNFLAAIPLPLFKQQKPIAITQLAKALYLQSKLQSKQPNAGINITSSRDIQRY
ncbi:MAG: hypothetical protein ACI86X_000992 [Moritella sp.]|jgi:uncharacterized protein YbjT (DUF2867 family)